MKALTTNDLEIAIDSGNLSDIRKAREEGLDINVRSRTGNPMLYNAVLRMSKPQHEAPLLEVMKELVLFPNFDINQKNSSFGFSALTLAIRDNKLGFAKFILENGADINVTSTSGRTPLMEACEAKNTKAIELLLQYNPDVNIMDTLGETALTFAMSGKFMEGFDLLLRKSDITLEEDKGNTRIYNLCRSNSHEMCQKFCDYGQELGVLDILRTQLDAVKPKYKEGPDNYFFHVKMYINALQMNEKLNAIYSEDKAPKKAMKI
jgi:ankyrin repeat protein